MENYNNGGNNFNYGPHNNNIDNGKTAHKASNNPKTYTKLRHQELGSIREGVTAGTASESENTFHASNPTEIKTEDLRNTVDKCKDYDADDFFKEVLDELGQDINSSEHNTGEEPFFEFVHKILDIGRENSSEKSIPLSEDMFRPDKENQRNDTAANNFSNLLRYHISDEIAQSPELDNQNQKKGRIADLYSLPSKASQEDSVLKITPELLQKAFIAAVNSPLIDSKLTKLINLNTCNDHYGTDYQGAKSSRNGEIVSHQDKPRIDRTYRMRQNTWNLHFGQ